MLDVINRYAHGFVFVPVAFACKKNGLFKLLHQHGSMSLPCIVEQLSANRGHLLVALRMMESLGWVIQDEEKYSLTSTAEVHHEIPENIMELYSFSMDSYLVEGRQGDLLEKWFGLALNEWNISNRILRDFLNGVLFVPLLIAIKKNNLVEGCPEGQTISFQRLNARARQGLERLLIHFQWAQKSSGLCVLTDVGRFMIDRILIHGVTASYKPMLRNVSSLLFGDPRSVFGRDKDGHETHLDRTLNVIGSGFQHEKYFAAIDEIIISVFSSLPLEEQPKYVADMGCGDGTLLKRIYEVICSRSARGTELRRYPVLMIGIDFNAKALAATENTLADIPHLVLKGDIADPESMLTDLKLKGIGDPENILHIRSFLDHDRPYIAPVNLSMAVSRGKLPYTGVYVDDDGNAISPLEMIQSLVEHFERWAVAASGHGLIIAEVHCLDPKVISSHLDKSESFHFDAYQAFSMQHLVESEVFLRAAAEAGFFPKPGFSRRYPKTFPFSRITIHWFERRSYIIRHPYTADLPQLEELEKQCWPVSMRSSLVEIRRRMEVFPEGQCVLDMNGRISAVIYTQRITRVQALDDSTIIESSLLHQKDGPVLQLLGISVHPMVQDRGLGDQLLEFMLQWAALKGGIERVAGVTRCKNYAMQQDLSLEEYIRRRDRLGKLLDPILRFHEGHGAIIKKILPGYRPEDRENEGKGILIEYDLQARPRPEGLSQELTSHEHQRKENAPIVGVLECIHRIMERKGTDEFSVNAPLKEIGLDSLDLMELRSLLSSQFGQDIQSTFFFKYSTPKKIADFFAKDRKDSENAGRKNWNHSLFNPTDRLNTIPLLKKQSISKSRDDVVEPIAVIGMSCRFPCGADTPEKYWNLLNDGSDAITFIPKSRWDNNAYYDADRDIQGKIITKCGGFLENVDLFDASFFRISPREASCTDPQQRILLESVWEALENAGINPETLAGAPAGVFIGICSHDYELLRIRNSGDVYYDTYFATGNSPSTAAGRVSYFLDLRGPALSIDTACSSSLVAVHTACQNLRDGDCEIAVAGGINLILSPELSIAYSRAGMLSAEGRCKTFDSAADGYVRSEGCGIVIVKKLSQALEDKDNILAVIRGSAVNQDGASNGLTAPNGFAQEAVIRKSLSSSGIDPVEVSYVEAHGTGTPLGDPVEVQALEQVYGQGRTDGNPLILGSVKTNIGHTEAAAGIAGLIKVILSLQNNYIPPHLHFRELNPNIQLNEIPAIIAANGRLWKKSVSGGKRVAAVSSFGSSGTNCHVIVEDAPATERRAPAVSQASQLITLSAKNHKALVALAEKYRDCLGQEQKAVLPDISFTTNVGRAHFDHRLGIVSESCRHLCQQLSAFAAGEEEYGVISGEAEQRPHPKIAFLFTGQGSQYAGMGRELYETQPVFRETLDRCDQLLRSSLEVPLLSVLFMEAAQTSLLNQTAYTQPALFALEYAVAQLWRSWGIKPSIVMGHSVGEYVAACVAGVFSLEDGLSMIAERGRLMQALPRDGQMAVVFAGETLVREAIDSSGNNISIAAINGPANIVISGDRKELGAVVAHLEARGMTTFPLQVSHAFHSSLMEPMLPEFAEIAAQTAFSAPRLTVVSNLTGCQVGDEIRQYQYWCDHIRRPVNFQGGMETLFQAGCEVFLEIGPGPVLNGMGAQCLKDANGIPRNYNPVWLHSLQEECPASSQMMHSLGKLYALGHAVDFAGMWHNRDCQKLELPVYPWQRQRYWLDEPSVQKKHRRARDSMIDDTTHPLLNRCLRSAVQQDVYHWEFDLGPDLFPWLADHLVQGRLIVPAAAFVEMALAASAEAFGPRAMAVVKVEFKEALFLEEKSLATLQLVILPDSEEGFELRILSRSRRGTEHRNSWREHVLAKIKPGKEGETGTPAEYAEFLNSTSDTRAGSDHYRAMRNIQLDYGPFFQVVDSISYEASRAIACLGMPKILEPELAHYHIHPSILDGCLQAVVGLAERSQTLQNHGAPWLPVGIERIVLHGRVDRQASLRAHIVADREGNEQTFFSADVFLLDNDGQLLIEGRGIRIKRIDHSLESCPDDWLYELEWHSEPLDDRSASFSGFLPSPGNVRQHILFKTEQEETDEDRNLSAILLPELEKLSTRFIVDAFIRLGVDFKPKRRFSLDDLLREAGIVDRHHRLTHRLLDILEEEGYLKGDKEGWTVCCRPDVGDSGVLFTKLCLDFPESTTELELLGRCGENLAGILSGKLDALEMLFPQGSLSGLEILYRDALFSRAVNRRMEAAVQVAVNSVPEGRTLRILEVGAGTGGLTAHLLHLLPQNDCRFVFTDIGALFVTQAREKFKNFKYVEYEVLDIEKDPEEQGFSPKQFDLVIAANCLHATRDMRQTLANVLRLLAPQGLLLLIEGSRPQRWIDLIFGLTEGWWLFEDTGLRPSHPLLSPRTWRELLRDVGFSKVATAGDEEETGPALFQQTVVVARAPEAQQLESDTVKADPFGRPDLKERGGWLVFQDRGGIGKKIEEVLRSRGEFCISVSEGVEYTYNGEGKCLIDFADAGHFEKILTVFNEINGLASHRVLYLRPLDEAPPDEASPRDIMDSLRKMCGGALLLVQSLLKSESREISRLVFVTRYAQYTGAGGEAVNPIQATMEAFGKVVALEHPELHQLRIDLDWVDGEVDVKTLLSEIMVNRNEEQVSYRKGTRLVPRIIQHGGKRNNGADWRPLPADRPFRLDIEERGTLEALKIVEQDRIAPQLDEVEIRVRATGLNFKDLVLLLGMIPDDNLLGFECAGTIERVGDKVTDFSPGDEVIAAGFGAFSTFLTTRASLVAAKPQSLSFEEGAAIPIAFLTAHYGLRHFGELTPGEKVLIHAASGGVGLAAIQLARLCGAEIFATAGSSKKRAYLRSLGVTHVLDSRSIEFAEHIMEITGGTGVDVVLNCLSGDFIEKSFAVLANGGRFIEIGKRGIWTPAQAFELRADVRYRIVDLAAVMEKNPETLKPMLSLLLTEFQAGRLVPLPLTVKPMEEIVDACRHMRQARQIGKIVVNQPEWGGGRSIDSPEAFSSRASYLVTGGFGGLGIGLSQWLLARGARNLVLVGRSGPSQEAQKAITEMQASGARIFQAHCDVSEESEMARLFTRFGHDYPPLRGVFHLAGFLDDGAITQLSPQRFEKVFAAKILGAWNLHCRTRRMVLDCFVLFSSWTSFLGSPGQANHSAANAFMDALVWKRRRAGLPGLSINWGAWSEIGAAAKGNLGERLEMQGIGNFSPDKGLKALGRLMSQGVAQVAVMPFDYVRWCRFNAAAASSNIFAFMDKSDSATEKQFEKREEVNDDRLFSLKDALEQAKPGRARRLVLETYLKEQASQILRMPVADIDIHKTFKAYGMDSLTALEYRNRIEIGSALKLSAALVWNYPTIKHLMGYLAEKMSISLDKSAQGEEEANSRKKDLPTVSKELGLNELLNEIELLSDEEARLLFDEKS